MIQTHNIYHEQVSIEPYNYLWHIWYQQEATTLTAVFKEQVLGIEHYGSTAVEGMSAKPIIGILLGLPHWHISESERAILINNGYFSTIPCSMPDRMYLKKQYPHAFTLAITTYKSSVWFDHLIIRDYLQAHTSECKQYSRFKQEVIDQGHRTLEQYRTYKKPYVDKLFKRAQAWYCKNQTCSSKLISQEDSNR